MLTVLGLSENAFAMERPYVEQTADPCVEFIPLEPTAEQATYGLISLGCESLPLDLYGVVQLKFDGKLSPFTAYIYSFLSFSLALIGIFSQHLVSSVCTTRYFCVASA